MLRCTEPSVDLSKVKQKRREKRITLETAAKHLGFQTASPLSKRENGLYQFRGDELFKLAALYGCDVTEFL
ncbi:MAG: helix-turn-helix transcriptional regulator [Exiguobacterium sp.]|uniref:Helix-turn-helix domain-containing protein n=1 Tax=Exiguobacterium aestuarii TaxID=273527 RepID=A0ABW2PLB5_9BACL|nr:MULTISPECIES: helix-turn-helix transcriptional regulator [Exiguobacterium]MBQ6459531.1 helix-turn-helix transcriptional regulator [Exiguobacterium sp.]MBR3061983.1 helix-turn-helix transcriptional regulator [Exiguobacterium sp.]MCT4786616.1 helix-turn-helix domain-containing protein [Exiguobacterium aestuarii]